MIRSFSKLLICVAAAAFSVVQVSSAVSASGSSIQTAAKTQNAAEQLETVSAPGYILSEMQTGTVLYEKTLTARYINRIWPSL